MITYIHYLWSICQSLPRLRQTNSQVKKLQQFPLLVTSRQHPDPVCSCQVKSLVQYPLHHTDHDPLCVRHPLYLLQYCHLLRTSSQSDLQTTGPINRLIIKYPNVLCPGVPPAGAHPPACGPDISHRVCLHHFVCGY